MDKNIILLSFKLFNVVPKSSHAVNPDYIKTLKFGFVADPYAAYALEDLIEIIKNGNLTSGQLNATFHKSWQVIQNSSREELFIHQILHYLTTYGSNFESDYVYFPAEKLEIPELTKIPIKVVKGVTTDELIKKSLHLLTSGIALDEKTIDDLLSLLAELKYAFESVDHIRNKEAQVKIIAQTGIFPSHPVQFLRFLVFLATKSTLLIKNLDTIAAIKKEKINISAQVNEFGLHRCAEIFNRFKPIWLAFKSNENNKSVINEISRLSKRFHQPLSDDILNLVTSIQYADSEIIEALKKVNNFRKIRLLHALNTRLNQADAFLYRIRNGKAYAQQASQSLNQDYYQHVFKLIYSDLLKSVNLQGRKVSYPHNIDYSLPSSEKMFIGNFPAGTKITSLNLVSGVYWENKWGANDLDVSALYMGGKVGWNSAYKTEGIMYSGDITDAPDGATELLYTEGEIVGPALSMLNIYSGKVGCKFKLIVGSAPEVSENYMLDPNELILEAETSLITYQQILGMFLPATDNQVSFVLINSGFGNFNISNDSAHAEIARSALYYQFAKPVSLKKFLQDAGAIFTDKEAEIDFSPKNLKKDTFINLFS
jgi:hypothetical protein